MRTLVRFSNMAVAICFLLGFSACNDDYADMPKPAITVVTTFAKMSTTDTIKFDVAYQTLSGITGYCFSIKQEGCDCVCFNYQAYRDFHPGLTSHIRFVPCNDTTDIVCSFNVQGRDGIGAMRVFSLKPNGSIIEHQ